MVSSLLAALLLVAVIHVLAQGNSPATRNVTECDDLVAKVGLVDGRGVLDEVAANSIDRNFQKLLDCLPSKSILELAVNELQLDSVWIVTKPVTLEGTSDSSLSIKCPTDASDAGAFMIKSKDVSFVNIEFSGCDFNSTVGLIHAENSKNLTLRDVKFTNITNHDGPCCMSVMQSDNVLIDQVTASRNTGGSRGGVFSFKGNSTVRIFQSRFNQNIAAGLGGVISAEGSDVKISEGSFDRNKARGRGGAVSATNSGSLRVSNSEFLGNRVEEPDREFDGRGDVEDQSFEGGAISIVGIEVAHIENSTFIGNRAPRGGALLVNATDIIPPELRVSGCTFRSNEALDGGELSDGGALYLTGVNCSVTASVFENNEASDAGGAIFGLGLPALEVSHSLFAGNAYGDDGGGIILLHSQNIFLHDTNFTGNYDKGGFSDNTHSGGAIHGWFITDIHLSKCHFAENRAMQGGALQIQGEDGEDATVEIKECSFERNSVTGEEGFSFGGAVTLFGDGLRCSIESSTFEGNQNLMGSGGALISFVIAEIKISNSNFVENFSHRYGGAVYSQVTMEELGFKMNVSISDTLFLGNSGGLSGGALHFQGHVEVEVLDCDFLGNFAEFDGGAVHFVNGSELILNRGLIENNTAKNNGGGLWMGASNAHGSLLSAVFTSNVAVLGGGMYVEDEADVDVENCTFEFNRAQVGGGALCAKHGDLNAFNTNLEENTVVSIRDSNFSNNKAGELFAMDPGSLVKSVAGMGGAVMLAGEGVDANITGSVFTRNLGGIGGAVYMNEVLESKLEDSIFELGGAVMGGGLAVIDIGRKIEGSGLVFVRNNARTGGGFSLTSGRVDLLNDFVTSDIGDLKTAIFRDVLFEQNIASEGGGGVDLDTQRFNCSECRFIGNLVGTKGASQGSGGALQLRFSAVARLVDSIIDSCAAGFGGGVYANDGFLDGLNVTMTNNSAASRGGGVAGYFGSSFTTDQSLLMKCDRCFIDGNRAERGGGMHVTMRTASLPDCSALNRADSIQSQREAFDVSVQCKSNPDYPALLRDRRILLVDTSVDRNTAKESGLGMFIPDLSILRFCCGGECLDAENSTAAPKNCKLSVPKKYVFDESRAVSLGTSAKTVLISPISIDNHASGDTLPDISVTLLDAFEKVAPDDMTLRVKPATPGAELFSTPVTRDGILMSRNLTVTGVALQAAPGEYILSFEFSPVDIGREKMVENVTVTVRDCAVGEVAKDGGKRCEECGEGSFSFDAVDKTCRTCPKKIAKCAGAVLTPLPGHWHANSRSADVHECLLEESCDYEGRTRVLEEASKQGELTFDQEEYPQCKPGYTGVLCGSCEPTHGKVNSLKCVQCNGRWRAATLIVLLLLVLVVLSIIFVKSSSKTVRGRGTPATDGGSGDRFQQVVTNVSATPPQPVGNNMMSYVAGRVVEIQPERSETKEKEPKYEEETARASDFLKVLVNFAQVTGAATAVNANWRSSMLSLLTILDMSSGVADNNTLVAFECAFSDHGFSRAIKTNLVLISMPFIVWLVFVLYYTHRMWEKGYDLRYLRIRSLVSILAVIHVSYISLTRLLVRFLYCVSASPLDSSYWAEDTSVLCYESAHALVMAFPIVPLLFLVSIGFPVGLLFQLVKNKDKLEKNDMKLRYGFFFRAYKRSALIWEVAIIARKALVSAIVVFGRPMDDGLQADLVLFVLFGSLFLHMHYQPFIDPDLNFVESVSISVSIITFIIGSIVSRAVTPDSAKEGLSAAFILVVVGFVLYVIKHILQAALVDVVKWIQQDSNAATGNTTTGMLKLVVDYSVVKLKSAKSTVSGRLMKQATLGFSRG